MRLLIVIVLSVAVLGGLFAVVQRYYIQADSRRTLSIDIQFERPNKAKYARIRIYKAGTTSLARSIDRATVEGRRISTTLPSIPENVPYDIWYQVENCLSRLVTGVTIQKNRSVTANDTVHQSCGDMDRNNKLNVLDINVVQKDYNKKSKTVQTDLNSDGVVNTLDEIIIHKGFNGEGDQPGTAPTRTEASPGSDGGGSGSDFDIDEEGAGDGDENP